MNTQPLRALVGARVSVIHGPQKVSHIAQQETGAKWVAEHGHTVIGTVHDLGVSASISPFEREDLGPWLADDKCHEWDVLVFSKLDRLFRSTRDCVKFAEWAEQHSKMLVFAEDGLTLNYRGDRDQKSIEAMMSELFVYLGSFFAQLELNRFKSRALDGHRVLRQTDRWVSGVPPLGFKVVDHPSGKGRGLATDTEAKELLHQMADKLIDGWSFIRIAAWLNDTGAQTNNDRAGRARVPKKPKKPDAKKPDAKKPHTGPWTVRTVVNALTLPRTQGLKMHHGTTVLDGAGEPIRLAPPTFDADTWQQIQRAVALRQVNHRTPTASVNPMLGIGECGCLGCPACTTASVDANRPPSACGASLAHQVTPKENGGAWRYYRCGRTPRNCKGVTFRADALDELLEETFLEQWGDSPVTRRVFVPGEDHSHELDRANQTIASLRADRAMGLYTTPGDEQTFRQQMKAQLAKRDALAALPIVRAGWITEETGQTYMEVWPDGESADSFAVKRKMLLDAGIKFVLERGNPAPITHLYVPQDRVPIER